jgi:hypothetical protein
MTNVLMIGREVKRVALDFDAPVGKTWEPRLRSPERDFPACPTCGPVSGSGHGRDSAGREKGDGLTPAARQIEETFYALHLPNGPVREIYRWDNKISQDEVDNLVAQQRLSTWIRDDSERGGHWEQLPRDAAEVNEIQSRGGLDSFDALDRWKLVRYRCERLGIVPECPECNGHGDIATDEEREAADNWQFPEPPEGPGWQMWQTVTEGGPVSPVFETPTELAQWLADNEKGVAGEAFEWGEWMRIILGKAWGMDMQTNKLV